MLNIKSAPFILFLAVMGIAACNNPNHSNTVKNQNLMPDSGHIKTLTYPDTIVYDTFVFPLESAFSGKVLTAGTFHEDEVWDNAAQGKWFGLFLGKAGYYLAETKLKTKRIYDAIVDENENEKTGWDIQTTNKDSSIILMEALNFLTTHHVQSLKLSKEQILPGDTIRINYLGIDYELFATGGKKKIQDDPAWFEVWNYKLYLTAIINGEPCKSLLVAQPYFDDKMIDIIFAGDIDADGILDLIIDTSNHYNATRPTLYLSKPSGKKGMLKPIGGHTSIGC